jgi:tetratricopeptide (TPR) repeat protein
MRIRSTALIALSVLLIGGVASAADPQPNGSSQHASSHRQDRLRTASAKALARGDASTALRLANRAILLSPRDAWAHYDRAVALGALEHPDAASRAYEAALKLFGDHDPRGRALALYGRANAFDRAGRCDEARSAYGAYADEVRGSDPAAASRALAYAGACHAPGTPAPSPEGLAAASGEGATAQAAPLPPAAGTSESEMPDESETPAPDRPFDASVAAYRAELVRMESPGAPERPTPSGALLRLLADAIAEVPGAGPEVTAAADRIRQNEARMMLGSATAEDRAGATKDALTSAANAMISLANGPYRSSPSVVAEATRLRAAVASLDATPQLRGDMGQVYTALDEADRVLEALQKASPR